MFENLIAARKPSWNRRWLIIISLTLSAAVVVVLLVKSMFHLKELPPPAVRVILVEDSPLPPPMSAPGRAAAPEPKAPKIQPPEIAKVVQPPRPEETEADEESDQGQEGGVRDGVPGAETFFAPAPGPAPESKPRIQFDESMVQLKKISGPDPQYTQEAQEHKIEGPMVIKCVITEYGAVHDCRVLKTQRFMDRAVVEALEQWRYEPYVSNGKVTEVEYTFKIMLRLPH